MRAIIGIALISVASTALADKPLAGKRVAILSTDGV